MGIPQRERFTASTKGDPAEAMVVAAPDRAALQAHAAEHGDLRPLDALGDGDLMEHVAQGVQGRLRGLRLDDLGRVAVGAQRLDRQVPVVEAVGELVDGRELRQLSGRSKAVSLRAAMQSGPKGSTRAMSACQGSRRRVPGRRVAQVRMSSHIRSATRAITTPSTVASLETRVRRET